MIVTNKPELNACFARLIWANLLIQDETVAKMWLSNDKVGSNVIHYDYALYTMAF